MIERHQKPVSDLAPKRLRTTSEEAAARGEVGGHGLREKSSMMMGTSTASTSALSTPASSC